MNTIPLRQKYLPAFTLGIISTVWLMGCSSDRHGISAEDAVAPKPPGFLIGPAALLLTNSSGYSARLAMDSSGAGKKSPAMSGRLLVQGSHLLYAPTKSDKTFLWDAQTHSGYILSEALQGYAPVSSPSQFTNPLITAEIAGPASQKVNGHPGHEAEISVAANDGSVAKFSVWRAADFNDLPVRVKTVTASAPFELNLLEVRRENFRPALFLPPDGFVKYGSPELMNTELLARKSKLRSPAINNNPSDEPALPQHKNL